MDRVVEQAADQELEAEIIDPLAVALVDLAGGGDPAIHETVADGQGHGQEPVVAGGAGGVLADRVEQLVEQGLAQALTVEGARSKRVG